MNKLILFSTIVAVCNCITLKYNYTVTLKDNGLYDGVFYDHYNDQLVTKISYNHETRHGNVNFRADWFNISRSPHTPGNDYNFNFWYSLMKETLEEINKNDSTKTTSLSLITGCYETGLLFGSYGYVETANGPLARYHTGDKRFTKMTHKGFPKVGMLTVKNTLWKDVKTYLGGFEYMGCSLAILDYQKMAKGEIPKDTTPTVKVTGNELEDGNMTLECSVNSFYPPDVITKWIESEHFKGEYKYVNGRYYPEWGRKSDYEPGEPGFPWNIKKDKDANTYSLTDLVRTTSKMSSQLVCVVFHDTLEAQVYTCSEGCNGELYDHLYRKTEEGEGEEDEED
ncbi:TNF binding protein [Tanapox virus]|uniref:TNF binding protein n=1 Tax=Tanapox virus TaxID=99000 RepID=Q80G50_9POXV|nr:TNF-alpha binding protein 2L [Tanapox virus]ABQ43473.1 TNF binding protein [Tanapox virus]ABQ43629.1 TNF binding protein [Tanapox virus]